MIFSSFWESVLISKDYLQIQELVLVNKEQ